jgi:hypothetical protein
MGYVKRSLNRRAFGANAAGGQKQKEPAPWAGQASCRIYLRKAALAGFSASSSAYTPWHKLLGQPLRHFDPLSCI